MSPAAQSGVNSVEVASRPAAHPGVNSVEVASRPARARFLKVAPHQIT